MTGDAAWKPGTIEAIVLIPDVKGAGNHWIKIGGVEHAVFIPEGDPLLSLKPDDQIEYQPYMASLWAGDREVQHARIRKPVARKWHPQFWKTIANESVPGGKVDMYFVDDERGATMVSLAVPHGDTTTAPMLCRAVNSLPVIEAACAEYEAALARREHGDSAMSKAFRKIRAAIEPEQN